MKTISGLGIGLSLVCVFLLLALVAEVYYLLRWKKKIVSQESEEEKEQEQQVGYYAKELIQLFCFKKPEANNGGREVEISRNQDLELGFEAELMKLHNHRFLFTIIEETKADLESDDGKSRLGSRSRRRSLSDLPLGVNDCTTPGFTPLASPTTLTSSPLESYSRHGFNPLFESDGELEFNKFFRSSFSSSSSPPPKFKFLRDAEEKLRRRLIEEAKSREQKQELSILSEGSFLKFLNPAMMNREEKQSSQESDETVSFSHSSSSCTNLRTLDQKSTLVV
ncbi:Transmembrane protein [Hirschfeldia incana]|nr:Transmembrane protein [Hirschfeldia incana]